MNLKNLILQYRLGMWLHTYSRNIIFGMIPRKLLIKYKFRKRLGRRLNLNEPKYFNDKLQWLKLNWRNSIATQCADKYQVRNYVDEKIGSKYLNKLYSVYDSVEEINLNELPESFVLKTTHDSGTVSIIKDKNDVNWKHIKTFLHSRMKSKYYLYNGEWVYKGIKPRIICEEMITDNNGKLPKDYKIFCFNGEPQLIEVIYDRFSNIKRNFYDCNWDFMDLSLKYPNDPSLIEKPPKNLTEMLEISKTLAEGFPHVRVDFYNTDGKVIFGEMTFFHESGYGEFKPLEYERIMGEMINLEQLKN